VEAADSEEENEFMFRLAEENDFIGGIVIWLDMESPGFADDLARYLKMPKFVGIRPTIESIDDVVEALLENLCDLTSQELEDIFRGNASRFYRI